MSLHENMLQTCYIIQVVITVILLEFGSCKSPFRRCNAKIQCDDDYFCDNYLMYCSPCKDLCVEGFSDHCRHYCAGSKYIRNIKSQSAAVDERTLFNSKPIQPVYDSRILFTTPDAWYHSGESGGPYEPNGPVESEKDYLPSGRNIFICIAMALTIVGVFIAIYYVGKRISRRCSYLSEWNINNRYPTAIMNETIGQRSIHQLHKCANCNMSAENDPLCPENTHCSSNVEVKCNCKT